MYVAPSAPPPPPSDNPRPTQGVAYVLIADPDPQRAAMLRDMVELGGYDVVVTRNGDEAKAMLRRRHLPVLVVANLSLPRLDGFALLADLRRLAGAIRTAGRRRLELEGVERRCLEPERAAWRHRTPCQPTPARTTRSTRLSRALPALRRESGPEAVAAVGGRARTVGRRDHRSLCRRCRASFRCQPGAGFRAWSASRNGCGSTSAWLAARCRRRNRLASGRSSGRCWRGANRSSSPTCSSIRYSRTRSFRRLAPCAVTRACR